jgi:hypothetical protein
MHTPFFTSSSERLLALKNTRVDFAVQVLLGDDLYPLGVNPLITYINTLTDFPNSEACTSQTLFDEALTCVEKQTLPAYTQGVSNIFSKRYSFAAEDRAKTLDLITFEKIVIHIVTGLIEKPSMDLYPRTFRYLTAEDLHGALKVHLPDVDPEGMYVTGFYEQGLGQRTVSSSEKLIDYLLGHFRDDAIPYHSQGTHQGIYTVAFSGEERYLHPKLMTSHLNDLMIKMVPDLLT